MPGGWHRDGGYSGLVNATTRIIEKTYTGTVRVSTRWIPHQPEGNTMIKHIALIAALSIGSVAAHAAGGYAGVTLGGFNGQGGGYTSTATVGGSNANTGSYGQGSAQMHSSNEGSAYAHGGANVTPTGANSYTSGGSTSNAESASYTTGFGNGQTVGGVGNDYSANAWSNFNANGAGFTGSVHFGGF